MATADNRKLNKQKRGPYALFLKRLVDIVGSFCGLVILSPLLAVLAVLVRIKLGSPVIFKQQRPGRIDKKTGKEKIFTLYKFRTMTDERNENGELLPDEKRLTKFGQLLRSTSLDELPELLNILKGDMSIVGPRPLAVQYLPYYTKEEHNRHSVRPGLTGAAQANGRSFISWEEIFEYDLGYTKKVSLIGDIKIIFCTVYNVLKRENIADASQMEEIDGQLYVTINNEKIRLHQPLDVERETENSTDKEQKRLKK